MPAMRVPLPAPSRASSLRPCFVHKSPPQGLPTSLGLSHPASISACFLRVPWTAMRSDQSILKEISPECSLQGLMLKLKLQYFAT